MRIRVDSYGRRRDMELSSYLQPDERSESGQIENLSAKVDELSETIGRLLELMVEEGSISLTQAMIVARKYDKVEVL